MKLYMAVDFIDDMIPMAWDRERLKKFMEMNYKTGTRRIYWIYHGNREDGFWENTGTPWQKNFIETFAALGNPYLKAAATEAHIAGLEIFAVYKPFELAINFLTRENLDHARLPVAGGAFVNSFKLPLEHPEAMMQRRNTEKIPATAIILVSAAKLNADHRFQLWKSDDNRTYRPIGTELPGSDGFRVTFDISKETANFFAIENQSSDKVANRLASIIEVIAAAGEPVQCALGLVPRKYYFSNQKFHLEREFDSGGGFSREGFYFDYLPNVPSAVSRGEYLEKNFNLADNGQNIIGVSLALNSRVPGAPEPAEPATGEYWLGMIKKMLDCGVDGIDIRITNHNSVIDWSQYGFNLPVTEEYIKRYGVNPRTEEFDREKLRRLRGEFYTAFLEKAAVLVKNSK
ncbi:MAG: hypothetical protein PHV82_12045, partial [Victivallaceae bacterium]|nr:hypothetical protein [Victivallaceae bacterium]